MQFWKVRIKPGKPLAYGVIHNTPTFGLPGNPVSCQVGFLQFVRPWIRLALGDCTPYLPVIRAKLCDPYTKKAGRAELCRVILQWDGHQWLASLAGKQSSGSQTSMVIANGLMLLSEEAYELRVGSPVNVQVIRNALLPDASPEYSWS
jgi:molybdopterin molybdotransferase